MLGGGDKTSTSTKVRYRFGASFREHGVRGGGAGREESAGITGGQEGGQPRRALKTGPCAL